MSAKHRAIIIGGGFGGLYAARELSKAGAEVEITLIDKNNYHLFQPLLYQVATGGLSPGDIASPLRAILSKKKNIKVVKAEITDIDPDKKTVSGPHFETVYDTLIVATGSHHHYFGNDHWAKKAPGLKGIEDALQIRALIFDAYEQAELESDPDKKRRLLTFIVVGGGPTGVELAGALGELCHRTIKSDFKNIDPEMTRIILVEGYDRVLATYDEKLSRKAVESLEKLGVEVLHNSLVTDIGEDHVKIKSDDNEKILDAGNILWAAGVQASALGKILAEKIAAPTDKVGRIKVNNDLTVPGHPEIFIIGDLANCPDENGNPLPGVANVAMQQGRHAADSIKNRLKGNETSIPFRFRDRGSMAVIGRNAAVAEIVGLKFSGFWAWLIWAFIHITYLIEFDNKLIVLIQWAGDYFTRKRGARLITGNKDWLTTDEQAKLDIDEKVYL